MAVYSSDLRRCSDTATGIAGNGRGRFSKTDHRLRERDVGDWSGHTREEISAAHPAETTRRGSTGAKSVPAEGETSAELLVRVAVFPGPRSPTEYKSGTPVVAVTHGGWIKTAAQWVLTGQVERIGLGVASQASLTVFSHSRNR